MTSVPFPRAPLAVALAAALAVASACGDDDDTAEADGTTTTEAAVETTSSTAAEEEREEGEAPAPVGDIAVELLDPGAEPRQELRLGVEQGTEQTYVLHQEQEISIDAGGQTQATATATEQEVTYAVDEVGDGVIVAKTTYGAGRVLDDPPVDAQTRQVLEQLYAAFEGAEGSATFDERGTIVELEVPSIEVDEPQLQLFLDTLVDGLEAQGTQLAVPFPEEAVGVGGRWRVSASFELAGLPFEVATEVVLTAVGDGSAEGDITQTLSIPPGPVEVQGTQAEVVSGEVAGGGTVRWDLSTPLASVDQEVTGDIVLRIGQGASATEVRQTLRQRYAISPV